MATNEAQADSYNAGYNKGRWPNDPHFNCDAADFADREEFEAGFCDGVSDAEQGAA